MADLLGNDIGLNYKGLLNLDTIINTGLDGTLRVVTDGEGDSSPLYLSTTQVKISTTLLLTGNAINDINFANNTIAIGRVGNDLVLKRWSSGSIGFGSDGVFANSNMVIDTSGNVGIGTTSPSYPLTVSSTSDKTVYFTNAANGSLGAVLTATAASGHELYFGGSGLRVTALGIGVTPSYKLDVYNSSTGLVTVAKIASASAGLYIGSLASTYGMIWSSAITPSTTNYCLYSTGAYSAINATSALYLNINDNTITTIFSTGLSINKSTNAAQLDIVAASSTVGLYVKGAASTDIARFYTSANALVALIDSTGQLSIPSAGILSGGGVKDNSDNWGLFWANNKTLGVRSDGLIGFSSGNNGAGGLDTSISRNAAGVMEVNTGTVGTLGSINVAGYKVNGNAGVSGTGTVISQLTVENGIITSITIA